MVYAIVGLVLANIITIVVAIVFNQQTKLKADALAKEQTEHARTKAAAELAEAVHKDEKARLESVITYVKTELKVADAQLAACASPDVVRSLLNNLFPSDEPSASSSEGAGVSEGASTEVKTNSVPGA